MGSPLNRYNFGLFNSGTYTPFICDIENVTQSATALVTTTIDHAFVVGQEVQFSIPQQWGMRQLDGHKGYVTVINSSTEFTTDINTLNFDMFITPTPPPFVVIDPAQVAGIGDFNTGTVSPGGVPVYPITIPGSYQNQPPG